MGQSHCTFGFPLKSASDPAMPQVRIPRKVIKGGSYLCAPNTGLPRAIRRQSTPRPAILAFVARSEAEKRSR
jgi:hypothetical protein